MNLFNDFYRLLPYIFSCTIILNIIGNMIKITFKMEGKYIIWILLLISIVINFSLYKISFESFFISFIIFSFSVSNYDLLKYFLKIAKKN